MSLRVIFMGTPDFAVHTLRQIVDDGHQVVTVYTQPPRPAGRRGLEQKNTPVHTFAQTCGIDVHTPLSLKSADEHARLEALKPDVIVVVAYGLILPREVLLLPKHGCLNVHASLLPRWRGAAPIQRAIMSGDDETGIAIMQMEVGLDTGPVVLEQHLPINNESTAASLHDELAHMGAQLMSVTLARLARGERLTGHAQAKEGVTYAEKISKEEAHVNFDRPAHQVLRHIHGLSPFPGAWCLLEGDDKAVRVKLLQVALEPDMTGEPGTVLDDRLAIGCRQGAIRPVRMQREGRSVMDLATFLNGLKPVIGSKAG